VGGSVATPGATCTIVVNVTGTQSGTVTNTTGAVSSTNGGTGATSNTATLSVALAPSITKSFNPTQIPQNGASTLTLNITNPNTNVPFTGVAFTDSLPAGLVVAATPNLSNTCGGTATAAAGSGTVSLSGGALASSTSCVVSVSVQGTAAGVLTNSVTVSSNEGGTGNTSQANITVVAPPTIAKAFGAATIPVGGTTTLTFNITNPNSTVALTGIAFGDSLPTDLSTATTSSSSCGGTVQTGQISGVFFVSLSGGTLPANGSCSFTISVKGIAPGNQPNVTGHITSIEGGTGGTASAPIVVLGPPILTKAFIPDVVEKKTTSNLSFTINNPNPVALTGVGFTDTLPSPLVIATPNGLSVGISCVGGTITATPGTANISVSGVTIPANSSCTFSVNYLTGNKKDQYTNTTSQVISANGGTGGTATAILTVGEDADCDDHDLQITKPGKTSTPCSAFNHGATDTVFSASSLPPGVTVSFIPLSQTPSITRVNMVFTTNSGTSSVLSRGIGITSPFYAALFPILGLVGLLGIKGRKDKSARLRLAMLLAGLLVLMTFVGCGGGSFKQTGTPAGTFQITVSATSASTGQSASTVVNLTVLSQGPQH
jgi:hypothetical protein